MECVASDRISGPCHECHQKGQPCHVVTKKLGELRGRSVLETRFYCKDCCPVHRQTAIDWPAPPALKPLDNCIGCLRVERDELRSKNDGLRKQLAGEARIRTLGPMCGAKIGGVGLACELAPGHAGVHEAGKCNWDDGFPIRKLEPMAINPDAVTVREPTEHLRDYIVGEVCTCNLNQAMACPRHGIPPRIG